MNKSIKYTLILLGCLFLANVSMAAYQYGDYLAVKGHSLYALSTSDLTLNFMSNISNWDTLTVQATDAAGNVTNNTVAITGQSVNIGTVNAGDSLKFFLTSNSPVIGTAEEHWSAWGSGWDTSTASYEYLHFGANYGPWGSQYVTTTFQVEGSAAPTGQPLPGIWATLLIGGASLGAFTIRKRKFAMARINRA